MLTLVVKALPEITDFGVNYTQIDLEDFVIERFLPGQSDDEAAAALMLRMEVNLYLDVVLYVPGATHGILSVDQAIDQGFDLRMNQETKTFEMLLNSVVAQMMQILVSGCYHSEDTDIEQDSTLEEEPYKDDHENEDDSDVSMYEPSQNMRMTSDDDNSEINSSFTHEYVDIQSTKHTVDLEEGEIGDVSKSDDGDETKNSNDGDVSRQSSVGSDETNKSQEETSVENEADENDFENDLNQSMHSGDGTSRNGDENGDENSVAGEFGSVDGENPDQKVDDDQQHEDSIDRNENESSNSVDGGIRVPIGPRDPSDPERVIIP
ncbi:hypothetical protein PsorP6_009982 [Peronosclerospora sorghi]|uniref:Uncharacterized protein n=1 Tax=Peronosclerospora sorghi TaxID=230839 RepID=A0ACC0VZG8_9STRA|nr:hypothetical protein PsorP6_009982 [Peronosclerospora sorghi]